MIRLENVSKTFHTESGAVAAVKNVTLHIHAGEIFGIIGLSAASICWSGPTAVQSPWTAGR